MTRHTPTVPAAPDTVPAATTDRATSTLVRSGGTAALVVAGTYVVGFAAMVAYLVPQGLVSTLEDPAGSLDFLRDHHAQLSAWYFVLYLVGGAAMALVALGVGARLAAAPTLARVSTALGLIWSGMLIASGSVALVAQHLSDWLQNTALAGTGNSLDRDRSILGRQDQLRRPELTLVETEPLPCHCSGLDTISRAFRLNCR